MKHLLITVAALSALLPGSANAANAALESCGNPSVPAGQAVIQCRFALERGGINTAQQVGANINLGEGLIQLKQYSLAIEAFDAAEALAPTRPEVYIGRARAQEARGKFPQAARDWARALGTAPNSLDVRLGRGAFYLRINNPSQALKEFNEALIISAEAPDADALYNRGLTLIALNEMQAAVADFTRLLMDYPNDAAAYYHRGRALDGRDDAAALRDFEKARTLSSEWGAPWYAAGRILDRQGKRDEANSHLRRAFELGHSDPWLLQRIQSLGG